jgi:hypothetical protein
MSRILPDEERIELRQLVEEALSRSLPGWADKIREGVRSDMDERFEMLGLAADDHKDRAEIRKDMEFVRGARMAFRLAAGKVGGTILSLLMVAFAGLAGYGGILTSVVLARELGCLDRVAVVAHRVFTFGVRPRSRPVSRRMIVLLPASEPSG